MINDSERREVARKLRGFKEHRDEAPLIFTEQMHNAMVIRTIRAIVGNGDIFQRLADLIDRPTCKNIGGEDGTNGEYYDFFCSACGFAANVTDPKYCPNCGAEVVE